VASKPAAAQAADAHRVRRRRQALVLALVGKAFALLLTLASMLALMLALDV
jgi:hypothetical protein